MFVMSLPPTDDHTFSMFKELINDLPEPNQVFYMWSNPPNKVINFLTKYKFNSPVVVIAIKDLLDGWKEFNFWNERQQVISSELSLFAQRFPDKKFILFTSCENLELELSEPNLHIIPWGGDLVNQKLHYRELEPVFNKNFNSDKSFICLNRNRRDHRIVTLSYLFGKDYTKHGYVSYLSNQRTDTKFEPIEFLDRISWEFNEDGSHDSLKDTLLTGYSKMMLQTRQNPVDDYEIYSDTFGENDNASNFNLRLRPKYENSFVEIVSESTFCAPGFNITEKTSNAFFACNFPIILGGAGIVQHLRDLGLDMFDDIVDHGYDQISNPLDRIVAAIDKNSRLLTDIDYVKDTWKTCMPRFESNLEIIRNIYDWYDARTKRVYNEVVRNICNV